MVVALVLLALLGLLLARMAVVRHRRRIEAQTMVVTTRPGIELEQPYGGWDADPYDAYTGHGPRSSHSASPGAGRPDFRPCFTPRFAPSHPRW